MLKSLITCICHVFLLIKKVTQNMYDLLTFSKPSLDWWWVGYGKIRVRVYPNSWMSGSGMSGIEKSRVRSGNFGFGYTRTHHYIKPLFAANDDHLVYWVSSPLRRSLSAKLGWWKGDMLSNWIVLFVEQSFLSLFLSVSRQTSLAQY